MKTALLDAPGATAPDPPCSPPLASAVVIATFLAVNAIGISLFKAYAGELLGWPRMAA